MTVSAYLHGTTADLAPGSVLLPGAVIGRSTWDYSDPAIAGDEHHVWVSTCIENTICNVGGSDRDDALFYVYEVEPIGKVAQPRPPCPDFTCSAATVLRRVAAFTPDGEVIEEIAE